MRTFYYIYFRSGLKQSISLSRCLHILHLTFVFSLSNARIYIYLVLSAKIFEDFKRTNHMLDSSRDFNIITLCLLRKREKMPRSEFVDC